ncbi:MAG: VWA domain-containing protein [Bryobacteraceae bacterium]
MKVTRRAFAASAWAVSRCRGQEPVFCAETRLVVIDAQVAERRTGRVIEILTREDFVIEDEGEPQEIKVFDFGLTPLDLVLLIDVSGSMLDVSRTMAQALRQAVRELDAMDRVALIVFSNRAKVVLPLTESRTELQSRLEDALKWSHDGNPGRGCMTPWRRRLGYSRPKGSRSHIAGEPFWR